MSADPTDPLDVSAERIADNLARIADVLEAIADRDTYTSPPLGLTFGTSR